MISIDIGGLLALLLVYMRVVSFLFLVPVFGFRSEFIPLNVRLALGFAVGLIVFSVVEPKPLEIVSSYQFTLLALKEFLFGFTAGFLLRLLFDAVFIAGEIMAVNMGLGFLVMFLPHQPQTTVMAGFLTIFAATLFLSLGGAEIIILGLVNSFNAFPLGGFELYSLNPEEFFKLFYQSFMFGFKLSIPILAVALFTNIILAIVNRFIPQINVFMVGLPLQLMIGLSVLALAMPVIGLVLTAYMRDYLIDLIRFLTGM
jgi:flagellar biosynthetic protein FliR